VPFFWNRPRRPAKSPFTLKGGNIPFVKYAKYLGVLFYRKITWNPYMNSRNQGLENIYYTPLIKWSDLALNLYTVLTRHLLTFASPAWKIVSGTHSLKMKGLEDKVLLTTDKFPRRTQIRKLHVAFRIPCFNNFIKNRAGSKRKSYKIIGMNIFATREAQHRKQMGLELGGCQACVSSD